MCKVHPSSFNLVKAACRIEDVIESYVPLKRKKALCPFHIEKTPSLVVWPKTQTFKCMGCGVGGDVIEFVKLIEPSCSTATDAVRLLAAKHRLPIELINSTIVDIEDEASEIIIANEFALKFFRKAFRTKEALRCQWHLKNRGYEKILVDKWELGYAPKDYRLDYDRDILLKADLIHSNGRPKFVDRIIFPIRDDYGRLVAFAGRSLNAKDKAKYINTSQTPAYQKKNILYGLNKNLRTIKKHKVAILVEGYTDVHLLERTGFLKASVAVCGTSFTKEQANKLAAHIETIILMLDSDKAGKETTVKAIALMWEQRINVAIFVPILPTCQDPGELALLYGLDIDQHIEEVDAVKFMYENVKGSGKEKSDYLLGEIAKCGNAFMREELLRSLEQHSPYHYTTLLQQLNYHIRKLLY